MLTATSIVVHSGIVDLLIGTRGSIVLPQFDSIFLNILPVTIAASLVVAGTVTLLTTRHVSAALWPLAAASAVPPSAVFLFGDLVPLPEWLAGWVAEPWFLWHVGLGAALHFGTVRQTSAKLRQ